MAAVAIGVAIGGDHPLVDAPGRLHLDVPFIGEQFAQPPGLPVGEQVRAGVQGPPGAVEGVTAAAASSVIGPSGP